MRSTANSLRPIIAGLFKSGGGTQLEQPADYRGNATQSKSGQQTPPPSTVLVSPGLTSSADKLVEADHPATARPEYKDQPAKPASTASQAPQAPGV
ncbi:MAG TPA: hypothetical protein VE988_19600, partial [Gemmataceae bacterium]|nr:hypothetical protein [Gemmataceae bacterium]